MKLIQIVLSVLMLEQVAFANLISNEQIAALKKETVVYRLKNNIPLFYRKVPKSEIIEMVIQSTLGEKDLSPANRVAATLMVDLMPKASQQYNKQTVAALNEKYAFSGGCKMAEYATVCSIGTTNDFWQEGLRLFASIVKEPLFEESEMNLSRERLLAAAKAQLADPSALSDNALNKIYYEPTHPYLKTLDHYFEFLPIVTRNDLVKVHKEFLNASRLSIAVVGSLPEENLISDLNGIFQEIPSADFNKTEVAPAKPAGDPFVMVDHNIPTAHFDIAFAAPPARDRMTDAFKILARVINEIFFEELRIAHSLSYSTYANYEALDIGRLSISGTTSKPQELFNVVADVLLKMKTVELKRSELDEYRQVYATAFFLTQESHGSIAQGLLNANYWRNSPLALYELPRFLSQVTSRDVLELAKTWLIDPKIAVVFPKGKFDVQWSKDFISKFTEKPVKRKRRKRK